MGPYDKKMKRLLPTLLGLCCIADASAQLKVQSVLPHGAAPEKTAPAVYDSTANIRTGGDAAYYESLVGQRILFYPCLLYTSDAADD